jgi:hypothetical protein
MAPAKDKHLAVTTARCPWGCCGCDLHETNEVPYEYVCWSKKGTFPSDPPPPVTAAISDHASGWIPPFRTFPVPYLYSKMATSLCRERVVSSS